MLAVTGSKHGNYFFLVWLLFSFLYFVSSFSTHFGVD